MSVGDAKWYVIAGPLSDEEGEGTLYWSNDDGWTVLSGATLFTRDERDRFDLPYEPGARWEALPIAETGDAP